MRLSKSSVLLVVGLCACAVSCSPMESPENRQVAVDPRGSKSVFDLTLIPFLKITVSPTECRAKSDNSSGICSTSDNCRTDRGKEDGTCANGYGVCCVYEKKCGGTVNKNITYLVNDAYPEALKDIGNCQYIIEKANSNVCQLRLDFLSMTLKGPGEDTTCDTDTFTFVGTAGANPTVICGTNTGQHMYLDLAPGSAAARINIATTDKETDRSWRIKVTQIACNSPDKAPPNCLQYYTEYSGTLSTFNYKNEDGIHQLGNQRYSICIKTREGFCGIKYSSESFSLSGDGATGADAAGKDGDTDCAKDYVLIPSLKKDGTPEKDRRCGNAFLDFTTYSQPFEVRVVTDGEEVQADEPNNRGFSMRYTQIPC
ncbi:uncharacterized protein LOC135226107 isoform X1 [Macrobrachium nipponense]|uniref:uncharacterized protein LOC135226107 isoform X1 n=1 Tax=Macrobrachium nipponense TaxID=159736 RepID=UPI0030C882AB